MIHILGCLSLSSIDLIEASRFKSDEFIPRPLNILSFPMMFLSEIWFSLEIFTQLVWWLVKGVPLWHTTKGVRRIMNEGAGPMDMLPSFSLLGVSTDLLTLLGSKIFIWTPE